MQSLFCKSIGPEAFVRISVRLDVAAVHFCSFRCNRGCKLITTTLIIVYNSPGKLV